MKLPVLTRPQSASHAHPPAGVIARPSEGSQAHNFFQAASYERIICKKQKRVEWRELRTAEVIASHSGVFSPLQVAPSFACSVASLSQSPGHQLPGCHNLHCGILTDYQLGWGRPSTWFARHADAPSRSNTLVPKGDRRMDTPSGRPSLS